MNMLHRALAFLLLVCGLLGSAQAELVVVVSARSPAGNLSRDQISDIYLNKLKQFPGGTGAIEPVMQASGGSRESFLRNVMGKSEAQVKSYWAKLTFSGKGSAPQEVANAGELKKLLAGNPNMIGYLDKSEVDSNIRIVHSE